MEHRSLNNYVCGFTLVFAIVFTVIVTAASLLFLSYYHLTDSIYIRVKKHEIENIYCYHELALLQSDSLRYDVSYSLELGSNCISNIRKTKWGVYDLYVSIIARDSNIIHTRSALIGYEADKSHHIAICLNSNSALLTISDTVRLSGECYVPAGKVETKLPAFPTLANATLMPATSLMPDTQTRNNVTQWVDALYKPGKTNTTIDDSITNSFLNPTTFINGDTVVIKEKVDGNIIVCANVIVATPQSYINNIVLIGGTIILQDRLKGCMQIFSNDIHVGNEVILTYPSILSTLHCQNKTGMNGNIQVGKNCKIFGGIVCPGRPPVTVTVGTASVINGEIISSGNLVWDGRACIGSIFCDKIIGNTGTTSKTNYIRNTIFDADTIAASFTYSLLFPNHGQKKIVKWINLN